MKSAQEKAYLDVDNLGNLVLVVPITPPPDGQRRLELEPGRGRRRRVGGLLSRGDQAGQEAIDATLSHLQLSAEALTLVRRSMNNEVALEQSIHEIESQRAMNTRAGRDFLVAGIGSVLMTVGGDGVLFQGAHVRRAVATAKAVEVSMTPVNQPRQTTKLRANVESVRGGAGGALRPGRQGRFRHQTYSPEEAAVLAAATAMGLGFDASAQPTIGTVSLRPSTTEILGVVDLPGLCRQLLARLTEWLAAPGLDEDGSVTPPCPEED